MAETKLVGRRGQTIKERLLRNSVILPTGCREWHGAKNPKGYGNMRPDKLTVAKSVHRLAYTEFKGEIPDGLEVDHLCSNRACINPDHLELVTHKENINRGRHNQNHGKTHCIHGHEFSDNNTSISKNGMRSCRTCGRDRMRAWRAAR